MNQDILLAKIVPNTTDSTWSQAYTTLNVYMTLSIENENSKAPVTSYGKEILEKLQREFFALDDKSLDEIKKAVGNVVNAIEPDYKYSIIIGAIVKNILYIVTASKGRVVIKRGSKIGTIAEGEEGELIGFSGELKHNDIVIFETRDFSTKIKPDDLKEYLTVSDVSQIAENITPLIHGDSKGTEAAIILQFKDLSADRKEENQAENEMQIDDMEEEKETTPEEEVEREEVKNENPEEEKELGEKIWSKPEGENTGIEDIEKSEEPQDQEIQISDKKERFKLPIPAFPATSRKTLIGIAIIILIFVLAGGIFYQKMQSDSKMRAQEFEKIYSPIQNELDEAVLASSLNKSQAVERLTKLLDSVNSSIAKFDENSNEHKKLLELKANIEKQIAEIGGGSSVENLTEVIKAGSSLSTIDFVTFKGADIVVASSKDKKVAIIEDGKVSKEFKLKDTINFVSTDNRFIYTLGANGITQTDRGNGSTKVVVEEADGLAFEVFSGNLYLLQDDDIRRFRSPSFTDASYFADSVDFSKNPTDMSISGSIYVLESGGAIERFTRGKKDDFVLSGLAAPLAEGSKIYTDGEFENFYVMDVKNQRVVSFNNDGEFQKQYEGSFIENAKSFAIDEKGEKGYVVSDNTLYSFDL